MMNRHSVRKSVTGALLAAGIAAGVLASTGEAQAAAPAVSAWHHRVEGRVVSRIPLTVRYGPGTNHWATGTVSNGMHVWVTCKADGTRVDGNYRWYKLADGQGWVSAHYVGNNGYVRWCNS